MVFSHIVNPPTQTPYPPPHSLSPSPSINIFPSCISTDLFFSLLPPTSSPDFPISFEKTSSPLLIGGKGKIKRNKRRPKQKKQLHKWYDNQPKPTFIRPRSLLHFTNFCIVTPTRSVIFTDPIFVISTSYMLFVTIHIWIIRNTVIALDHQVSVAYMYYLKDSNFNSKSLESLIPIFVLSWRPVELLCCDVRYFRNQMSSFLGHMENKLLYKVRYG